MIFDMNIFFQTGEFAQSLDATENLELQRAININWRLKSLRFKQWTVNKIRFVRSSFINGFKIIQEQFWSFRIYDFDDG